MGSAEAESRGRLPADAGRGEGQGLASVVRAGRPRSRVSLLRGFAIAALEDALLPEKNAGCC